MSALCVDFSIDLRSRIHVWDSYLPGSLGEVADPHLGVTAPGTKLSETETS